MSRINKARDRGPDGRILRKYRRLYGLLCPYGTPKWWRKQQYIRPRRHENRRICQQILLHGADPDGITPPLGNRKPQQYYW